MLTFCTETLIASNRNSVEKTHFIGLIKNRMYGTIFNEI